MKQMHTQLFYISFEAVKAKRFYMLLNKEADKTLTFMSRFAIFTMC